MTLQEDIKKELATAMKARDSVRMLVIRGLMTAFTNELVAKKRKPDEVLSNEDAQAVIEREAKKRKDSIEQFTKGGRADLADKEALELEILQKYLPEKMSEDEVRAVVEKAVKKTGASDPSKKGVLIGAVMKELKGKADGSLVKSIVDELLS